jgi:hypothetical protein
MLKVIIKGGVAMKISTLTQRGALLPLSLSLS